MGLLHLLGSQNDMATIRLGGILFARSGGLSFLSAFLLSYLGSTTVFFILFFLLLPVLNLLKRWKLFRRAVDGVENYLTEKTENEVRKNSKKGLSPKSVKTLTVFIFVALPLPMTGVWTGTAVAVFLGLKFREAVLPVVAGNFIAGLTVSLLAELFIEYVDIILYGLLSVALVLLIVFIVKVIIKGKSKKAL